MPLNVLTSHQPPPTAGWPDTGPANRSTTARAGHAGPRTSFLPDGNAGSSSCGSPDGGDHTASATTSVSPVRLSDGCWTATGCRPWRVSTRPPACRFVKTRPGATRSQRPASWCTSTSRNSAESLTAEGGGSTAKAPTSTTAVVGWLTGRCHRKATATCTMPSTITRGSCIPKSSTTSVKRQLQGSGPGPEASSLHWA